MLGRLINFHQRRRKYLSTVQGFPLFRCAFQSEHNGHGIPMVFQWYSTSSVGFFSARRTGISGFKKPRRWSPRHGVKWWISQRWRLRCAGPRRKDPRVVLWGGDKEVPWCAMQMMQMMQIERVRAVRGVRPEKAGESSQKVEVLIDVYSKTWIVLKIYSKSFSQSPS